MELVHWHKYWEVRKEGSEFLKFECLGKLGGLNLNRETKNMAGRSAIRLDIFLSLE